MYKKYLLSYTATAAILLFNIQFNAHAEILETSGEQQTLSEKTYETIHAQGSGKVIGNHLTVVGNKEINSSSNTGAFAVTVEGAESAIIFQKDTTIKGTDSVISLGVEAKNGANFQMTGGAITVSDTGALFWNNNNKENKLKDVTISIDKDRAPQTYGVMADKNSTVTLEGVTITEANNTITARNKSTVTVSGGSFDAIQDAIVSAIGSTILVTGNAKITSSKSVGLAAETQSTITMTEGSVTGEKAALGVTGGGHITVTNVTLKTNSSETNAPTTGTKYKDHFGALSIDKDSVIEVNNTQISDVKVGLAAKNNGIISMTRGKITASNSGAGFLNSKSDKNKLENVEISSGNNDALLVVGINADKNSKAALKDVTVTQAQFAISAKNQSTVTVSGGSFDATKNAITAAKGSTILLTDNAQITSSGSAGLYAYDNGIIEITGGNVTGKKTALGAASGGHIIATNVSLKVNEIDPQAEDAGVKYGLGVFSKNPNSFIELHGDKTTITDSIIGLEASDNGAISMTGGSIKTSKAGALFSNSNSDKNHLENVIISSSEDDALLVNGIEANQSSKVTLKDITITQAAHAIVANNHSTVTVSGGSFKTKGATIDSQNGSTVILKDVKEITSSENAGLYADDNGIIEITGGNVTGNKVALSTTGGGHITATDVILKTKRTGKTPGAQSNENTTGNSIVVPDILGALSSGMDSVIELRNATISDSQAGIAAQDSGAISIIGGEITASLGGAGFFNSNSNKNHLENVTISSGKDDALLTAGINANQNSAVTLKDVTVTQAKSAIIADDKSTVTISGGSFDAKEITIEAAKGSTIILTDNVQITSSNDSGLYTYDNGTISMTGGSIKAAYNGATFKNSDSDKNHLENVTISSGKDDALLINGINANQNSAVTLKDVTVTQAENAIVANDHSTVTISGGSFDAKKGTIEAAKGSTILLTDNAQITSSDQVGLHAIDQGSTITMTSGSVTGKGHALVAEDGGQITGTNVSLKTTDESDRSVGALSTDSGSIIELLGEKTAINDANIGLTASDKGAISMIGGSIKAFSSGAQFESSDSDKNHLENVTISSAKDDVLLNSGIEADQNSTVTLKNVTVTQAKNAIVANDHSTVTISGGSFYGKADGVYAGSNSTIILKDSATITSSEGSGLHAEGSESQITMAGGTVTTKNEKSALSAEKSGQIEVTNVSLITEGKGGGAFAGKNSTIQLHGYTTINNTLNGLEAVDGGKITSENLTVIGGEVTNEKLGDKNLDTERSGIWTSGSGSEIKLTGKTIIKNVDEGFYADGGSKIISGDLIIIGGESKEITTGVGSYESGSVIELNGKTTIENFDIGLGAANNSTVKMVNGDSETTQSQLENEIAAKKVALRVAAGGQIDLQNVSITAGIGGLQFLTLSEVDKDKPDNPQKYQSNEINLTNADIHVEDGSAILMGALSKNNIKETQDLSIGTVKLNKSKIHADILLKDNIVWNKNLFEEKDFKVTSNGTFTLTADHSTLEGRANIAKDRNVRFDLNNNTTWTLKNSTKEKDEDGNLLDIAQRAHSDVSVLNLNNSSVIFNGPTEEHYHTLHIGSGKPDTQEVYKATGEAKIYFNTEWSDGVASADQKTDRLLINGDISGTTAVYVTRHLGKNNVEENTSAAANLRGLSLIQVSGKAQEDSFKLVNGYTTRSGLPDMYTLRAYGPDSSHGKADIAQNLLDEKNENFWDFRLQPELLTDPSGNSSSSGGSGGAIAAPVPQTANYLVMPNALFYTGLTDMAKQNALLANIRTSIPRKEEEKNTGFFLYTYGSTGTLSSERGPLKYGYGADIRYAALQAGVTLAPIERQNVNTRFGLLGTYGQLSFTPKDIADVSKSTVDKWSLTAYASLQHDNGFYLDTLLSYGVIKGEIGNAIRGKTAKLNDAKIFSLSSTIGKQFATGMEGLTFEPQAQLAYQHLMFKPIEDADNFTIDINNPSQWLIRVGGRVTKAIATENNRPVSLYGKVNFIKTFGDDGAIHIGRDFDLDPMGPALEGGVGINAQLSHNFSLHGDMSYQQKLQKTGISGASFSGGVRYHF